MKEIDYLGHTLSGKGVAMETSRPTTMKQLICCNSFPSNRLAEKELI